ncbi:hypothetical protein N658DRAFT_417512 [Parathielavia hyrcaniae]|uniref:Pal1 cell morphology n=1 Tax=Parathielavia hyrcaniae TaxID=113614 RepID=A0AAN6Q8N0_9PEZI|nr:hypothetical protein N658DRAFT_417512 [Parathielavia hyrcaniae]
MNDSDDDDIVNDKQWAAKYILGPLYDPEPSQVCATRLGPLPTPPASANTSRAKLPQPKQRPADDSDEEPSFLRRVLSRRRTSRTKPRPPSPPRSGYPPPSGTERRRSLYTANPPQARWDQGTIPNRANSVSMPSPSADTTAAAGNDTRRRQRAISLAERYPGDRSHRPPERLTQERGNDAFPHRSASVRERYPSDMSHRPLATPSRDHHAADRVPHQRRHRRLPSDVIDMLDLSGPFPGVTYHHGGPFDAVAMEFNTNSMYSPIDAVRDSNMEALRATPREYVQDSLTKHVPLQGTAVIPPGMPDFGGRTIHYEEGADLMREEDAPGGPYKRWDHINYRDDDLKGKGEPEFSLDQNREHKSRGKRHATSHSDGGIAYYEMQPSHSFHGHHSNVSAGAGAGGKHKERGTNVRQRSVSNGAQLLPDDTDESDADEPDAGSSGLRRSNTTGSSIRQSLRRRFASLRKKKPAEKAGY